MSYPVYLRYEVLRSFRNWRFLILALAFPLVLYLVVGTANRHVKFDGIAFPVYFMTAMATLGTMAAVISGSAIIAAERASGWTRQMRITPLPVRTYFRTKVIVGYLRALLTLVLLALAGTALGVRLPAQGWLTVLGLFLVGLIPFAVLGILLGHLIGADAAAPAVGGIVTLFALLGGVYGFEVATSGPVLAVSRRCPRTGWCRPGRPRWAGTAGRSRAGS
jgi:ABC-2 type transport system permease protein